MSSLLVFAALFTATPARAQPTFGIVNGSPVRATDAITNSTVFVLGYWAEGTQKALSGCTGTLLTRRLVLTANHCVRASHDLDSSRLGTTEELFVYTGNLLNLEIDASRLHSVKAIAALPGINTIQNLQDTALIELAEDIPAPYAPVANILPAGDFPRKGEKVTVAGYGLSFVPLAGQTLSFDEFVLRRYSGYTVAKRQKGYVSLHSARNEGVEHGDSGGPAFVERNGQLALFGLASTAQAEYGTADYVDFRAQKTWIESTARGWGEDFHLP